MSLEAFKHLGLGSPKPISIRLLIVDRMVKYAIGILCDVFVKVASFIFPTVFMILDYEVDFQIPINLYRPFLAIARALVDMELE